MMVFGNVLALSDSSCHVFCCEEMLFLLASFMSIVVISGAEDGVGMGVATHYIAHLDLPIRFVVHTSYFSLDSFLP